MANIYDVAKEAGVSIATVSAVINESAYVSPKLKRRVEEAIRLLDYKPNLLARGLAKRESHTIGMIVTDVANPFFPEVVRGAQDAAQEKGYTLLLASSDDDPDKERQYLDLFLAKRVDGIILTKAPGRLPEAIKAGLEATETPLVQLIRTIPGFKTDVVVADDTGAAFEAASHLLRLGYRRIGMVTGVRGASTTRRRLAGYRKALQEWGIDFDRSLVVAGDYRVDSGYTAGLDLLRARPDAAFVSNYLMAVGFMKALEQYQMRCPEDLGVVTCDDYPWMDSFSPRLTTIEFRKYELGATAARVLIDRIMDRERPIETLQLRNVMCIRESCGHQYSKGRQEVVSLSRTNNSRGAG